MKGERAPRLLQPGLLGRCVRVLAWFALLAYVGVSAGAATLGSSHWSAEILLSLSLYFGGAGLLLALMLLAVRVRAAALIALGVAALQLAPVARLYLPAREVHASNEQVLKVASANLFMHNRDADGFRAWVSRESPDVLAVLEVTRFWKGVVEAMEDEYPHQRIEIQRGKSWDRKCIGMALLSKRPWSRLEAHRLPGLVFEAEFDLDGEPVLVRAVHAPVPVRSWLLEARDEFYGRLASDLAWPDHAVLVGDLNATMYSPALRQLTRETGLRDSRQGFGWLPSWRSNYKVHGMWFAIDHIFPGSGLDVVERYNGELPGSDHRPVVAVLTPRS